MIITTLLFAAVSAHCAPQEATVGGVSLSPFITDRDTLTYVRSGCRVIERGDVVFFETALSEATVAKIVHGLPGDQLHIKKGHLWINGRLCLSADKKPYKLSPAAQRLLGIYAHAPLEGYLVLGVPGSVDSTAFGPLQLKHIKAVVTNKKF